MTIEFFCNHCEALLRTPDSKAGLSAKCPSCGDPVWVPHESETWETENPWSGQDDPVLESETLLPPERAVLEEDKVPYADEVLDDEPASSQPRRPSDLGEIVSVSWKIYSENLGICLLATLIDIVVTLGAVVLVMIPAGICLVLLEDTPILWIPALMLTLFFGWTTALSATAVGHFRFFLALSRGEPVQLGSMFHFRHSLGPMAVAGVAFWAITVFGLLLFVIPGILAMVMFWPYGRLVVDEDHTASDSLAEAFRLTSENFWTSLLIVLLNFLVIGAANTVPVLGYLFAIPFAAVLHTVAYLHFRGEFVTGD